MGERQSPGPNNCSQNGGRRRKSPYWSAGALTGVTLDCFESASTSRVLAAAGWDALMGRLLKGDTVLTGGFYPVNGAAGQQGSELVLDGQPSRGRKRCAGHSFGTAATETHDNAYLCPASQV